MLKKSASWRPRLKRLFPDALFDEKMSRHTTFRIGGPADAMVSARGVEDLVRLYRFARSRRVPVFILGWGSNLLVRDGGIRGIVLRLKGDFEKLRFSGERRVWAGAGVRLQKLVMACAQRGLAGTEPLIGVPGTVGGGLVMNAGTREGEIGGLVQSAELFDPKRLRVSTVPRSRITFRYRRSSLQKKLVIGANLELRPGSKVDILKAVRKSQQQRLKTQPVHSFNVGSVFKNPPRRFVAKLIEDAGLKGRSAGGARISGKHANFIENRARATARDVLRLVFEARKAVRERTGIELELEMKVVGEEAPSPA